MEKKAMLVCVVVGFLGLIASSLAFAAEFKRIKRSEVQFTAPDECVYPRSPALALGLTAAVALVIAQIIINVATGCNCCRSGSHQLNSKWTLALSCFVVSWFTFGLAFLLLLTGAALNDQRGEENMYFGNYYCYVVKPGVFSGAAILSLATVVLGITYYITIISAKTGTDPWAGHAAPSQPSSVAMAQPQYPLSTSHDPVFVHEDTYTRRQFT